MRSSRVSIGVLLTLLLSATAGDAGAQGMVLPRCAVDVPCTPRCGDFVACPGVPAAPQVERASSRIHVTLAGGVLHYEVDETFVNHGGRLGEADYIFPLPRNAAFAGLKLAINGELVGGETMDASQARSIYEEIVRRQRDPALVEWMGYGMLRARIFPIQAGEKKRVVVRFDQVAPREGDALRVDYARGPITSRGLLVRPASNRTPDNSPRASFILDYPATEQYGTPYSPTHDLSVSTSSGNREVSINGGESAITLLVPVRHANGTPSITLLANNNAGRQGFALITLTPPVIARASSPRDVTFVLDVSGSMSGQKIAQARAAGHQLLSTLGPRDRFRLIDFSSDVRTFRDGLVYATSDNLRAASEYLDALSANGGTNVAGALQEALRTDFEPGRDGARLPLVLFITDGEPTVGETSADRIGEIAARLRARARLFTFGLGADVNVSLLETLALEGHGTANFVSPSENVERVVSIVASRLTSPIATDVRLSADGVRLLDEQPDGAFDIFAGQDAVVLARYSGRGRATLRFTGNTPEGRVSWSQDVTFPDVERGNEFVPRLWATQRVGYLSAERRRRGPSQELDDEIRSLGTEYGIPTELTSYLVREPVTSSQPGSGTVQPAGAMFPQPAAASMAAPMARQKSFDAAREATAQRAATSLAASDNAVAESSVRRRVGDRIFRLVDGTWRDERLSSQSHLRIVRIAPYTAAYFKVIDLVPELRPAFALGDRVIVAGHNITVEVAANGATVLSDGDATAIRTGW